MRILITGGLGFIGHLVVTKLEQLGHSVVITDTRTTYGIIPQDELNHLMAERIRYVKTKLIFGMDITHRNIGTLVKSHSPDIVIHLASFPRQRVVNSHPQLGSKTMSEGLLNLLEACVHAGTNRMVYVSSSMVYGDFQSGISEEAPCSPQGQYGIMKLAGEWLVRDYSRRSPLTHTIVRPSAVYGPRDVTDRVVARWMRSAMDGGIIQVNGPDERLDFTYVDDTATGIVQAALGPPNATFNITRGVSHTLLEAAEMVVKTVGKGTIEVKERSLEFPSRGSLNIEAARTILGYDPKVDIEEGFQRYYQWLTR